MTIGVSEVNIVRCKEISESVHMLEEHAWSEWLTHNIARNCEPEDLRSELLKNGFTNDQATERLLRAHSQVQKTRLRVVKDEPNFVEGQPVYLPHALKIEIDEVEMYGIDGFLSAEENLQLVELIRQSAGEVTPTTEEGIPPLRSISTCNLASLNHPLVEEIDERICRYMGIDSSESEPIEGQRFEEGQKFQKHCDYFDPASEHYEDQVRDSGQRTWTFMIYLNTTCEGGETCFTNIDLSVKPVAGTALVWNSLDADGQPNKATMHCGMPVKSGYKAVITKRFRSIDGKVRHNKTENELLKPLTQAGFLKMRMPESIYSQLVEFYHRERQEAILESVPEYISNKVGKLPSVLIELTDELRQTVHDTLHPLIEAWIGDYLEPSHVFGVREYHGGAVLKEHRDRIKTHIAGAIINIDQEVNSDWILVIEDHFYRRHNVVLKPGEMIFYESARLQHGRPGALDGERYANVFAHFKHKTKA